MTRPFQPIPRLTYEAVASQEEIYLEEVEEELRAILIFDDPTYFVTEKYEVPEMLRLEAARCLQAYSVSHPNNLVNALLRCADCDERDHSTVARDKGTSLTVRLHHRNRDALPEMRRECGDKPCHPFATADWLAGRTHQATAIRVGDDARRNNTLERV